MAIWVTALAQHLMVGIGEVCWTAIVLVGSCFRRVCHYGVYLIALLTARSGTISRPILLLYSSLACRLRQCISFAGGAR